MKRILLSSFFSFLLQLCVLAGPGDTTVVQTFTFGSPQDAWFNFPSDTLRCEKVLMKYTLKCNPAQSPACGEWDYLTYTYLYDHTGLTDSSEVIQPFILVNGAAADSVQFIQQPAFSYSTNWQYQQVYNDTLSLDTFLLGNAGGTSNDPFQTSQPISRSQFLWKASELSALGMLAGNITGMRFNLLSTGSAMNNLTIRFKAVTMDSLLQADISNTGFTTVYQANTSFPAIGWQSFAFINSFNWDGSSDILVEITFENIASGTNNTVSSTATIFPSCMLNAGADRVADFHQSGYVQVPVNSGISGLDSAITVSFWCYGNPALQPMDGTCFEAVDVNGNRILNAHLPWSNGNVYWDAGFSGTTYDRINQLANAADYEGKWNNWVFTKNVATGSMKIYLNGVLWLSGSNMLKTMNNIHSFRIGKGNWNGSQTYEGRIDEFTVFNKELSQSVIQQYLSMSVNSSHPDYSNLILHYNFNDGNFLNFADSSPLSGPPASIASSGNPLKQASDLILDFVSSSNRPDVIFEQGTFISQIDSMLVQDSVQLSPLQVLLFADSVSQPGIATDTLVVWPLYYNHYLYDSLGNAIDSSLVNADSTIYGGEYNYYTYFPQVLRYELARYITPYGNNLDLGAGRTWTFDVSDYRKLLADSVHLTAGNWQELLDLKFLFIHGTPPRDVLSIQNLWTGGYDYGNAGDPIDNHLTAKTVSIPSTASNSRWKSRITGHGMDTPENCAEFCPKNHYFKVNGVQQFSKLVWRDNCDLNPLYPQGGTWIYDRSNWCPGAEVWTYDFELTPHVTAGNTAVLDHDVQPYTSTGGWHYYQIEDQLVTYSEPNFNIDASLEEIISPSTDHMYLRLNPVCTTPLIRIRNNGTTTLTSLTITYGMNGAVPSTFNWTGSLGFLDTAVVRLGNFNWATGATSFTVSLSNPNNTNDEYTYNNSKTSTFTYPTLMPSQFVVEFKTNNNAWENTYTIRNSAGQIVAQRDGNFLSSNTIYRDTLTLADGCYTFEITDTGEDGLQFWNNSSQGIGYIRFKKVSPSTIITNFGADFGGQIYRHFTVGISNASEDYIWDQQPVLQAYPNPAENILNVSVNLTKHQKGSIEIVNSLGEKIHTTSFSDLLSGNFTFDMSSFADGIYFVRLNAEDKSNTLKVLIRK